MLGFRSIFAFLIILSGAVLLVLFILLPETQRHIAGNGSVPLRGIDKPLIYRLGGQPHVSPPELETNKRQKLRWRSIVQPLTWLNQRDILCLLGFGGAVYTAQSMVTASLAGVLAKRYHLEVLEVGLCFLPTGLGTIIGGQFKGWIMNRDMDRAQTDYRRQHDVAGEQTLNVSDHPDFPLERVRLRWMPYIITIFIASIAAYGFSLSTHIGVAFFLQFIMGASSAAVLNINTTYVTDLFPNRSASAVGLQNLVRCVMGAGGVAGVNPIMNKLGNRLAFLLVACFVLGFAPLQWIGMRLGPKCRKRRHIERESKTAKASETVMAGCDKADTET